MASDSNSLQTEQVASGGGLSMEISRLQPLPLPAGLTRHVPQALDASCLPPNVPSRLRPLGKHPPSPPIPVGLPGGNLCP